MGQQNAIEHGISQAVGTSVKPITSVWQAFEDLNFDAKCGGGGDGRGNDVRKCGPGSIGGIADVSDLGRLGFLTPDLTGFDQEAIDHSEGFAGFWHDVKSFFGSKETCEEKLNEHVMKNLSPKEKDVYKAEEKELDEYNRKWISWATQATINPGPPPEMPNLPMHNEVNHRVKEMEKKITEQIRSEMSPHDRARLDRQMQQYAEDYAESTRINNPMGTGEGFKPRPKPPALVRDYYERVKEAVDKTTR
jgi:hypothetical protein